MHSDKLDTTDIQLLEILQRQGRTKRSELAEHVRLSITSVSERLRKLEEHEVIRQYTAILDARRVLLEVTAFIHVMAHSSIHFKSIIARAKEMDEILEIHAITGGGAFLFKVRSQNTATLEKLLSEIQAWEGVKNTVTSVVLSSPKESTVLPLHHLHCESRKTQ